ncbi:MAG: TonB-dependent receptor, partial [Acidobacteriota bacterium]
LDVLDRLRIDVVLQIGDVNETVTVASGAAELQTETGELSDLIEGSQITELAINGRSFISLAGLTTGAVNLLPDEVGVQAHSGGVFLNGQRGTFTNWTVDGAQNTDVGNQGTLCTYPAIEALGEFRVLTSNYSAEYGTAGAGIISAATKSGGREFHGSLYYFHRNDALDAAPFFARLEQGKKTKSPLRLNNFGYTLGGPFAIPGKYNEERSHDFFFWSQEWKIRRSGTVFQALVPTAAMRGGDFSALLPDVQLVNPATGEPFPDNQIPSDLINPESAKILAYYPMPNTSGSFNFNSSPSVPLNFRQELIRWDHHFNESLSLVGRFVHDSFRNTSATTPFWDSRWPRPLPTIRGVIDAPGLNFMAKLTHVINPNLVHELNYSQAGNNLDMGLEGQFQRSSDMAIPELFPENRANRIPTIHLTGGRGTVSAETFPWSNLFDIWTFDDKWSLIRGNHSFKFGAVYMWQRKNQEAYGVTQGAFLFDGSFTGDPVADLLLGTAREFSELDTQRTGFYRYHQFEAFVQDDWKITPHLTLNLGLRYFLIPHLYEKNDAITAFVPSAYDPTLAVKLEPTSGAIFPDSGDPLNGVVQAGERGLPRGLTRTSKTDVAPRLGFSWDPTGSGTWLFRGGYGIGYYRTEGNDLYDFINYPPFARDVTINRPLIDDLTAGVEGAVFPSTIGCFEDLYDPPRIHQWSVGLQFDTGRLLGDSLTTISYVGNHVGNLPLRRDINQPRSIEEFDFNPVINDSTTATNALRPFLGFGFIGQFETSGRSNYHSLQANFNKRFSRGLKFQVAYTFGKALNNSNGFGDNPQNAYDIQADYGLAAWDVTHTASINYIWELPWFAERRGAVGQILGGWEISGITVFQSGRAWEPSVEYLAGSGLATRPDLNGSIEGPKTVEKWFNTEAFSPPDPGFFGNAGRNIIRGPGVNKWDVSLFKNGRIPWFGEEGADLQLRAEFFNAPNHSNFNGLGTYVASGYFGALISARDPRILQFGLKIDF